MQGFARERSGIITPERISLEMCSGFYPVRFRDSATVDSGSKPTSLGSAIDDPLCKARIIIG